MIVYAVTSLCLNIDVTQAILSLGGKPIPGNPESNVATSHFPIQLTEGYDTAAEGYIAASLVRTMETESVIYIYI